MRYMQRCVCVLFCAAAAGLGAQSLDELYAAAGARNPALAQRRSEALAAREALAAKRDTSFLSVSVASGQTKLRFSASGGLVLSAEPTFGVEFAEPLGTSASLGVSTSVGVDGISSSELKPVVSLTQPLSRFVWGKTTDLEEAKLVKALADAEEAVAARESALKLELYAALRDCLLAEYNLASAERTKETAALALSQARRLGTYATGTAGLAKLELEFASAEAAVSKKRRDLDAAFEALKRITGIELPAVAASGTRVPLPKDPGNIAVPGNAAATASVSYRAALRAFEYTRLAYELEHVTPERSLSAILGAGKSSTSYTSEIWDYAAKLSLTYGQFSASAGGGIETKSGTRTPYVSFSLSWQGEDERASRHDAAAAAANLAAAAAAMDAARESVSKSLASYAAEAASLAEDASLAELTARYATLLVAEREKARAAGLIDDASLAEARWERAKIAYENDLALCDRAILAEKVAALFPRSR